MSLIRTMSRSLGVLAGCALLVAATVTHAGYYLIGQVEEVDLTKRVIVISGETYRLGTPVRFTSDRRAQDLATGVVPGDFVRFNASPDGRAQPITELHVFSDAPL
jgi:hypothetical protein